MNEIDKRLARLLEEANQNLERKIKEMSLISRIALASTEHSDLRQIITEILKAILEETPAEDCCIWLKGWPEDSLYLAGFLNHTGTNYYIDPTSPSTYANMFYSLDMGESLIGQVVLERKPLFISDTSRRLANYQFLTQLGVSVGSLLALPLIVGAKCLGALCLSHQAKDAFKSDDLRVLIIVANHTANQVHKASLINELSVLQKRIKLLFSEACEPMLICNSSGAIIECNSAAQDYFKLDQTDQLGSRASTLIGYKAWKVVKEVMEDSDGMRVFKCPIKRPLNLKEEEVNLYILSTKQGGPICEPNAALMFIPLA